MRFAVAQINNSTKLLPNVRLGYELFDHCSDIQCFPGIFKLLSVDNVVQPWNAELKNASKVVAVVGLFTSTFTLTVAPLFMMDFIPMVAVSQVSSTSNCHFLLKSCCVFWFFLRLLHRSLTDLPVPSSRKMPSFPLSCEQCTLIKKWPW